MALVFYFCIIVLLNFVESFSYEAPENCEWRFRNPIKREVKLFCNLRTITSDFNSHSLNAAQSDYTVELHVKCSDVLFFQSSLSVRNFQRLYNLDTLSIEFCKINKLPDGTFLELEDLKSLSLKTYNNDWSAMALELSQNSLIGMNKLESLDLSRNNIWTLPNKIFCPVPNLKKLNLTWNRLQDISEISAYGGCGENLITLDLSGNDLVHLSDKGLSGLKSLKDFYLQNNEISMLADNSFVGLSQLNILNISSNRIVAIPPNVFNETILLRELYLQNNSISVLAPAIFSSLSHLTVLDMSNNLLTSDWINADTFKGLVRLVVLSLSHNNLEHVDPAMFKDLSTLQILDISHNKISILRDETFFSLANLHRLDLNSNQLTTLNGRSLSGLHVLSSLYLSYNNITNVDDASFVNCTNLRDLRLDYNYLSDIPIALSMSQAVRSLRLSHNLISSISATDLAKLSSLKHIDLSNNFIRSVSKDAFMGLTGLEVFDLSKNEITSFSHGIFDTNKFLELIRLDGNKLKDINGLFASLPKLLWLNVSDNDITWFDYALIPEQLLYLDLRNNKIKEVGNYFNIEDKLKIRTLDISQNAITVISPSSIPNSIQLLFANSNQISQLAAGTFTEKKNLSMVDLFDNLLTRIDLNSIRLPVLQDDQKLPEFYIGGNPIFCDCQMEWMHRINQISSLRQHPRVMDLDKVTCTLPYPRFNTNLSPFYETNASQFLCPYSSHCFALCQCCDFIACDCQMNCPSGCSCYHDDTWATNIVDCSSRHHNELPADIPMDATVVYMDGNSMPLLDSHHLIGRKNLQSLFINNSNVERIANRTFHGLSSLKILHMEDNLLHELKGYEFETLLHLRELYLQNNKLKHIDNFTFSHLKSISVLNLRNNLLVNYPVWQFNLNKKIKYLSLSRNSWSCECDYMVNFKNWLKRNDDIVIDTKKIICSKNNTNTDTSVLEISYSCENYIATSIVQEKISNDYLQPVLITLGTFFIVLVLGVVFAIVKVRIHKTLSKKCGLKWFPPDSSDSSRSEERNLIYDVFVSHSELDSLFINEVFSKELEQNDPCYKLCIFRRDYENSGIYIGDFIINSIDSSRQIILFLTRNFIENDWCKFSFKAAHIEAFKALQYPLITVIFGDVSQSELEGDLYNIVNNSTRLVYEDKKFWSKLKSCLPDKKKNNQHCYIAETNYIMRNNLSTVSPTHSIKNGPLIPNMVVSGTINSNLSDSSHQHIVACHANNHNTMLHHSHAHNPVQPLNTFSLLRHIPPHHHVHGDMIGDFDRTFLNKTPQSLSPNLSHSYMSIDYAQSKGSHIYASIDEPRIPPLSPSTLSQLQPILHIDNTQIPVFNNASHSNTHFLSDTNKLRRPHEIKNVCSFANDVPIVSNSYFI